MATTLSHGVLVDYPSLTSDGIFTSGASTPIGIVGISTSGSASADTPYLVNSKSEADLLFGTTLTESLALYLDILFRYGVTNVIAVKVANLAGIDAGITALATSQATLGISPKLIALDDPSDTQIANVLSTFPKAILFACPDSGFTVNEVLTSRISSTGYGTKSIRFVPCFPNLKNATTPTRIEPIAVHSVGLFAKSIYDRKGTLDNKPFVGVNGTSPSITVGWESETADSEKLYDAGVLSINKTYDNTWVAWGNRNGIYPEDSGAMSYISTVFARDTIATGLSQLSQGWLGQPGSQALASTLSATHDLWLSNNADTLTISHGESRLNLVKSNFDPNAGEIKWVFDITIQMNFPIELIQITIEVK